MVKVRKDSAVVSACQGTVEAVPVPKAASRRGVIAPVIASLVVMLAASTAFSGSGAQDQSTKSQPPAPAAPASGTAGSTTTLQGGVQKTVKSALIGLKSAGEALHKLRRTDAELYGECTRQEANLVEEPDVIGGTIIYIPINVNVGECLPPRKKWVDHYMGILSQLFPMVEEEFDGVLFPDDKEQAAAPVMKQIDAMMRNGEFHYQKLVDLTKSGPYDGQAIAMHCKSIEDELKEVEKLRKKLREIVKEKEKGVT